MQRAVRWIDTGAGAPRWNMAVDAALLRRADEAAVLRFYRWSPAAVSIGRFQDLARTPLPPWLAGQPVVRRLTGGGAIWHRDDLTFSIAAAPRWFVPPGARVRPRAAAEAVLAAVACGLGAFGIEAELRCRRMERGVATALCFERRGGVVLECGGRRLLGCAQRCTRQRWLLHATLPLTVPNAPGGTCVAREAGRVVPFAAVRDAIAQALAQRLGWSLGALAYTIADLAREPEASPGGTRDEAGRLDWEGALGGQPR